MTTKVLYNGAEAILYKQDNYLVKERISKGYRHEFIDNAKRKYPTRKEFKLLLRAKKIGLNVPDPLMFDDKNMKIVMEYIKGDNLKENLDKYSKLKKEKVSKLIGEQIRIMHENDIVHGDLTTSNMILSNNKIYFVDFGLGFISNKDEGKAVDLHLLKQALESRHYKCFEEVFKNIIKKYNNSDNNRKVLERLKKVELRGRYKRKNIGS